MNKSKSETNTLNRTGENNNNEKVQNKAKLNSQKTTSAVKLNKLKKKLQESDNEINSLKDQLLRKAAEFENYKKRRETEYIQLLRNANAELITEILPVLDDLERSIKASKETQDFQGLFKGVELIYKNLVKILENRGVKPIEAIGHAFDPERHDALMQVENEEHPSGVVVEEHLKGYVMNDRVLRHSQVLVSK
ncbi:MAG: nucleotide exchange factor GrpE [bacterium]